MIKTKQSYPQSKAARPNRPESLETLRFSPELDGGLDCSAAGTAVGEESPLTIRTCSTTKFVELKQLDTVTGGTFELSSVNSTSAHCVAGRSLEYAGAPWIWVWTAWMDALSPALSPNPSGSGRCGIQKVPGKGLSPAGPRMRKTDVMGWEQLRGSSPTQRLMYHSDSEWPRNQPGWAAKAPPVSG
ncbi:uncharacterized protein PgNI_00599 [Pyricularia grisea]|uniref:Uncharacterized protein n=1 Tax=Pyricularia grisea TaxID=148305 RepID=A0A6P8BJG8_PYRGI|nr:uncharacterized protein PgNI_00599 [Pyricularia grisea]TLD16933.1 hypothetical protein PgNI_00599 [Pyricularia grisea]